MPKADIDRHGAVPGGYDNTAAKQNQTVVEGREAR